MRGRPPTMASMMIPKLVWRAVCLYRLFSTTSGISPRFSSMTMRMPVAIGLVAQVGDALDDLVAHQVGDLLDQPRLVHLVRDLGDDDRGLVALLRLLELVPGTEQDGSASGSERVHDALPADDVAARREVGAGHDPQQLPQALVTGRRALAVVARVRRRKPLRDAGGRPSAARR